MSVQPRPWPEAPERTAVVHGYSFILTNMDVATEEKIAEVEWWYRHRTDIEALNRDAKHGRRCGTCPPVTWR